MEAGGSTEGKYFLQTADIETNIPLGNNDYPFWGTYDGGGHTLTFNYDKNEECDAPFRTVRDTTIKNLKTNGTITTSSKFASGVVGRAYGDTTVIGCRSEIVINSKVNGDGSHGGLVGVSMDGSGLTVEGCVFHGEINGESTIGCGGFVGFARNKLTVKNCYFYPKEFECGQSANFARYFPMHESFTTLKNLYYNSGQGDTVQGKQSRVIIYDENIAVKGQNGVDYGASGIIGYDTGMDVDGKYIAAEGETLQLTITPKAETHDVGRVY